MGESEVHAVPTRCTGDFLPDQLLAFLERTTTKHKGGPQPWGPWELIDSLVPGVEEWGWEGPLARCSGYNSGQVGPSHPLRKKDRH